MNTNTTYEDPADFIDAELREAHCNMTIFAGQMHAEAENLRAVCLSVIGLDDQRTDDNLRLALNVIEAIGALRAKYPAGGPL